MNKNITWKELKALNDLYLLKKTKANIQRHPYINYLLNDKGILDLKRDNNKIIITTDRFENFYEMNFKLQFDATKSFLENEDIEISARKNFTLDDIKTLMLISENKLEIKSKPTSIEDFSSEFFDSSKYLKNKMSVKTAVLKILEINEFSLDQKENQWRLVVDNQNPKAIVLCENKSFLKQPWIAKNAQIKLWYVGGNNIKILDDIDELELNKTIFYCCDWDLAGLQIYSRIKNKLKNRNKQILLLFPNSPQKRISVYTPYHKSYWNLKKPLSGLIKEDFSNNELTLINELIKDEKWIEEESMDLIELLKLAEHLYNQD